MPDNPEDELSDPLKRIDYHTDRPLDVTVGSPQLVQFLSAVATYLNTLAVTDFGGRLGQIRQDGLVEQVVGTESLALRISAGTLRDISEIAAEFRILWRD